MNHVLSLVFLFVVLPAHAALLRFDLRGEFEAAFDPPVRGTVAISHDLNDGPSQPSFADTVAPNGTLAPDYFVGTEFFSAAIPSTSPEEFGPIGPVSMRFGNGDALTLKPFANSQSISSVAFNRYRYSFDLVMSGEAFVFLTYELLFSPPDGVPFWHRAFVESLDAPVQLLAFADIESAEGMIELSQLNMAVEFTSVRIALPAAALPEPHALVLAATGILALWAASRRTLLRDPRRREASTARRRVRIRA
ncbi:hypothetical protein [Aromatoleum sp.]|uniref:hypothetical protein n=1 Tax=Aromatoleum sp. TaxID=2307007 RepID=UPI002FC82EE7